MNIFHTFIYSCTARITCLSKSRKLTTPFLLMSIFYTFQSKYSIHCQFYNIILYIAKGSLTTHNREIKTTEYFMFVNRKSLANGIHGKDRLINAFIRQATWDGAHYESHQVNKNTFNSFLNLTGMTDKRSHYLSLIRVAVPQVLREIGKLWPFYSFYEIQKYHCSLV